MTIEKIKRLLVLALFLCLPAPLFAGEAEGRAAIERGDYKTAYEEYSKLAIAGDMDAVITIALWYHRGTVMPLNYKRAMDFYIGAFLRGHGDAYNNIGVMYRDGQGVAQNRSISYALFLLTHLRGLGTEGTQARANRNLRREVAETTMDERILAVCFTEAYLEKYITSRGRLSSVPDSTLPSTQQPRIRDNDSLWLASEQQTMDFECPPPWN